MNSAQLAKYHITKKQWADARKARGAAFDQAALESLQQRTIGRVCSSKDFTQRDLDAMLGAFLAETRPGDLNAQLQQLDQPEARRAALERRLFAAGRTFITRDRPEQTEWAIIAYARGIVENLRQPYAWPILDEALLGNVTGIMERRAEQVARKADADCPY